MEVNRVLVLAFNLIFATMVISEVGCCSPSIPSFFQNDTIFQRTVRRFFSTELPVKVRAKPLSSSIERCTNSSEGRFSLDNSCFTTLGTCGRGLWGVKEIVASLQDCNWKNLVLITLDALTDTVRHCGSLDCGHDLVKNASTSLHNQNLSYDAASSARLKSSSHRVQPQKNYISHSILTAFLNLLVPVQHFQLNSKEDENLQLHLEEIIWTSYSSRGVRNFVWISPRPWKILEAAETVFRRHQRGRGALMVHKALFILIGLASPLSSHLLNCHSCKPLLLKETEKRLAKSMFDNVLFLSSTNYRHASDSVDNFCFPNLPHTLMWRGNRTREFETIPNFDIESLHNTSARYNLRHNDNRHVEQTCKLFPNIRTRMNGRHLILLCKEWKNFLAFYGDNGSVKYSGLLYDIADVLSISMNFTFTFQPDPEISRNMTWEELRDMMISGGFGDALFSLFYMTASLAYNFSQTQPIFHVNMTGAYFSKPHEHVRLFISRLDPQILVFSAFAFILILIYYTCLWNIEEMYFTKQTRKRSRGPQPSCDPSYLRYFLRQAWELGFALFGTCFSQGHVPQPLLFSGKILIFSWCIFFLMLTAIFKGHLASSLIKVNPAPPFTTFRELVDRTDYRWGHHTSSTFFSVMAAAKGNTLSKLYSGMMQFSKDDPGVLVENIKDLMLKAADDGRLVVIIDSFYLKEVVASNQIRNVKVIPDSLGINGLAPALPRDSELTDFMSEHILALYETDIFNVLAENMLRRLDTNATHNATLSTKRDADVEITDEKETNKIDVVYGLIFSACLVLVAIFALFLEYSLICGQSVLFRNSRNT